MKCVLLVEDDADSAEVVKVFLERGGHYVVHAADGKKALAALATSQPDVVILDLNIPELDGIGFLKVLGGYFRGAEPPIIVLTGLPDGPRLRRASELGVRHVFRKAQYQMSDLLACVNTCCERHEAVHPVS